MRSARWNLLRRRRRSRDDRRLSGDGVRRRLWRDEGFHGHARSRRPRGGLRRKAFGRCRRRLRWSGVAFRRCLFFFLRRNSGLRGSHSRNSNRNGSGRRRRSCSRINRHLRNSRLRNLLRGLRRSRRRCSDGRLNRNVWNNGGRRRCCRRRRSIRCLCIRLRGSATRRVGRLQRNQHFGGAGRHRWGRWLRLGLCCRLHCGSCLRIVCRFCISRGLDFGIERLGKARIALGGRRVLARAGRFGSGGGRRDEFCRSGQSQPRAMLSAPCGREAKTRCATSKPVIFTGKTPCECCFLWLTVAFCSTHFPATMVA